MDQTVETVAILIPIVAILSIFVALPALILHYNAKKREHSAQRAGEPLVNTQLQSLADRLEKRVQALETILDAEVPGWRKHVDRNMDRRDS